jgi:hypothetical protein
MARPLNNTFVYGQNGLCDSKKTQEWCETFRGGQYSPVSSYSRTVANQSNVPTDQTVTYPNNSYVGDWLQIADELMIDFPVGIVLADWGEQGYFPMNALGFGLNSSVYRALLSQQRIVSRSVSMFWGLQGPNKHSQLDGTFVIGGYDQAKVSGPNYTMPLAKNDDNCNTKMVVTITDLVLNFANGTDASLFNGTHNTALKACVDPSYPVLMTLPLPYFKVFQNFTNQAEHGFNRTFGLPFYSMVYNDTLENVYVPSQPCHGRLKCSLTNIATRGI